MEQEQGCENGADRNQTEEQQAKGKPIWSVTGTAIAIQVYIVTLFLLWVFIPAYVQDYASASKIFIESMFSLAVVDVIVVHAIMYYKQAQEANKQAAASAQIIELMVLTELPYMRIGSWKPPRICENGRLHVDARLRNSGRTIAWDVTAGCRLIEIGTRPPAKLPLIPTGENTWNAYGAIDTTESMMIIFKPLKVTDEQAGKLQEGKIDVFVDGVCRYLDSMGGKSYYTYGFTINFKRNITPRYERHHRVKQANPD